MAVEKKIRFGIQGKFIVVSFFLLTLFIASISFINLRRQESTLAQSFQVKRLLFGSLISDGTNLWSRPYRHIYLSVYNPKQL